MSAEFRQRHMRVIELNENDVASQIRMNHGRELEVVDAALDQILQGLDAFAYVKQRPDSRLEDAQMFLAVRSFNSLHVARQLLEHGYYQQASALVRMAMEDQLVAEDAETHPPTLDVLLDDKGSISSGDLTYGKMAERISPEAKKAWDEKYGDLSERAAHPRHLSLKTPCHSEEAKRLRNLNSGPVNPHKSVRRLRHSQWLPGRVPGTLDASRSLS